MFASHRLPQVKFSLSALLFTAGVYYLASLV